jgi:sigma-B regulation protein RsbU (phosphoserine phosphatase)
MPVSTSPKRPDDPASQVQRALRFGFYDWTREMPIGKRVVAWSGILLQGYAIYALVTRSLAWPVIWPSWGPLLVSAALIYVLGAWLLNGMLTSEFIRKTRLESEQIAARTIQQTLQPDPAETVAGYQVEVCSRPFRNVGGDYLDLVTLADGRTLLAVADVSGKGMPAALLSANLQALVRSLAAVDPDPLQLTLRINEHLWRYTPDDRFVTAVFAVLTPPSGELAYVNAGHNAPLLVGDGPPVKLEPTGVPLGLFRKSAYELRSARIPPGGAVLFFTDGLTDSIPGENPEQRLSERIARPPRCGMPDIEALTDPALIHDDLTIMLVKRQG